MSSHITQVPLGIQVELAGQHARHFSFAQTEDAAVAAELLTALLALLDPHGPLKTNKTIANYISDIRRVSTWAAQQGLQTLKSLTVEQFYELVRTTCRDRHEEERVRALLGAALRSGATPTSLLVHLSGRKVHPKVRTKARPPYTADEAERLSNKCKDVIREFEDSRLRIVELSDTFAGGSLSSQWTRDAAWAAWTAVTAGPFATSAMLVRTGQTERFRSYLADGRGGLTPSSAAAQVFPTLQVAVAFRVLLGLKAGNLPPEAWNAVRWEWVTDNGGDRVHVNSEKLRGPGHAAWHLSAVGPWSPGSLMRRWRAASEALLLPGSDSYIWRFWRPNGTLSAGSDRRRNRPPHLAAIEAASCVTVVDDWARQKDGRRSVARQWQVLDEAGHPMGSNFTRLRQTWFSQAEKTAQQQVGAKPLDDTHTLQQDLMYQEATTPPDVLDAAVEDAQRGLLARTARPLVYAGDGEAAARVGEPAEVAAELGLDEQDVAGFFLDGTDMFAANCRNPFDSPFGRPGQLCPTTVWTCLGCENALITPSKLPVLLRLSDHMEERSKCLPRHVWSAMYEAPWRMLEGYILPKFTDGALAAARQQLRRQAALPIPDKLEERA